VGEDQSKYVISGQNFKRAIPICHSNRSEREGPIKEKITMGGEGAEGEFRYV